MEKIKEEKTDTKAEIASVTFQEQPNGLEKSKSDSKLNQVSANFL